MKKILLDTDIGPDCDDAAALALVNMYAAEGMVDVLAVTHCTSNPYGVGAIRAIDAWYGHDFPVGTLKDEGFLTGEQTDNAAIYDLSGRRIMQPQRGQLYIRGGKKFIAQ